MSKLTPLHHAAKRGNETWVRELLKEGKYDINTPDNQGWTPLHYAASAGHEMTCWYLLEAGADLEAVDDFGETPLFKCAWHGHDNVVKHLLEWGANKFHKNKEGKYPLDVAVNTKCGVLLSLLEDESVSSGESEEVSEISD